MREALTDSKGRALCLCYRNGRRCRRLATVVTVSGRAQCAECSEGEPIRESCAAGFNVQTRNLQGWISREYKRRGR